MWLIGLHPLRAIVERRGVQPNLAATRTKAAKNGRGQGQRAAMDGSDWDALQPNLAADKDKTNDENDKK